MPCNSPVAPNQTMAKDKDLKEIELKVSVDCCDGCKKKVLKALSIKGILKTEIHPTLSKVTVVGNVDPHTLIKKLAKHGKMAEVLSAETGKPKTEEKSGIGGCTLDMAEAAGKDNPKQGDSEKKTVPEQEKINSSNINKTTQASSYRIKDSAKSDEDSKLMGGGMMADDNPINSEKPVNHGIAYAATPGTTLPPLNYFVNPAMVQEPQASFYHATTPTYMVPMTYYMPSSCPGSNVPTTYPAPNTLTLNPASLPFCTREYCCHDMSVHQHLPMQSIPPRFTEYFNDENTVGCYVM